MMWDLTSRGVLQDGQDLLVGCSDGQIRVFGPESGTLVHVIHDAHQSAVRALAVLPDGRTVVSGDEAGFVRAWQLGTQCKSHVLLATMKEHQARHRREAHVESAVIPAVIEAACMRMLQDAINRLAVRRDGAECLSASSDGSVILWDLASYRRRVTFSARTFFNDAAYCRDESQIVTAGGV